MRAFRSLVQLLALAATTANAFVIASHTGQKNPAVTLPSLYNVTLDEMKKGLSKGSFSSVDLVKAYIARIKEVNDKLHAVTELNPDALSIATELDAERKNGKVRGPLHGVPLLIKNNIGTADKMNNTAGSYALLGAKLREDSTVVKKLRDAGVIIIGKANMSQWANWRSQPASNGWSAHGGQTTSPFYPNQDSCGSSSGSGVASSIGLAFAALGTETDGSIVCPSRRNNIVGIKPTVGLTSRYGVVPMSIHQDTIGPMARTVKDAATILQVIAGQDKADKYTADMPNHGKVPDYVAACKETALKGMKIGVPRNLIVATGYLPTEVEMVAFNEAINTLKAAGATIVDPANFKHVDLDEDHEYKILYGDFYTNIAEYFASLKTNPNNITNVASLRAWTQKDPREQYPKVNTKTWDLILEQGYGNTDPRFQKQYKSNVKYVNTEGLIGTIKKHKLDAIVLPTTIASPTAATVGAPIVQVPLGFYPSGAPVVMSDDEFLVDTAPGIPFGISFLGEKWTETKLIGMAYAFEQKTKVQSKGRPYLVPKTELKDVMNGEKRHKSQVVIGKS